MRRQWRPWIAVMCGAVAWLGCESNNDSGAGEEGKGAADEAPETPGPAADITSVRLAFAPTTTAFGERHVGTLEVTADIFDPGSGHLLSADVACEASGGRAFSDEATVGLGAQSSARLELTVFEVRHAIGTMAPDSVLTLAPHLCQIELYTHTVESDAPWVQLGTWCLDSGGVKTKACPSLPVTDTEGAKVALAEQTASFVNDRKGTPWTVQTSFVMATGEEMPLDTFVQSSLVCASTEGDPVTVADPVGAPVVALGKGESARIEKAYKLGEAEPTACTWEIRRMTLPDDAGTLIAQWCITADGVADDPCPEADPDAE